MKLLKNRGYIRIYVALLFVTIANAPAFSQALRILSYNTMHGFEADISIRAQYIKWMKQKSVDIALYQEMNSFSQKELNDFATSYGHPYAVIMSEETGYPVTHPLAITSKYPIKNVEMFINSMWHGYVHAKVQDLHIFLTHLAPFTLKDRQKDLAVILSHTHNLPKQAKILIGGDFNSFSSVDSAAYGEVLLKSMQTTEGRLEPKSGTAIVKGRIIYRNNLNNGKIDYSVTDMIRSAGYTDAYYSINTNFKNTIPVKAHAKKNAILRRIDYMWLNSNLAKSLTNAEIIQDEYTDFMSDHCPVFISVNENPSP